MKHSHGIGFFEAGYLIILTLRFVHVMTWSWWIILLPVWIAAVFAVIVVYLSVVRPLITQARCAHDGGVWETQACDAICKQCGANLGFIGTWQDSHAKQQ